MSTKANDTRILFEHEGPVARIVVNRPDKLNAVTKEMGKALQRFAQKVTDDERIRVAIVIGAGTRAFSAGSDVGGLGDYGTSWQMRNRVDYARVVYSIRKPVIAAIRGYCIGGGLELALACDIRIATPSARFGAGEIKLGWHGSAGNTQLLPRLVGYGKALQILLTGDFIDAAEAHRVGLIQEVVPEDELEGFVQAMAQRIARNAPIAVQATKHLVRVSESAPLEVGFAYENDLFTYCFTTQDSREGIDAFTEKREPHFRGE